MKLEMERVAHKARQFAEADEWDIRQQVSMTPRERMQAARELKSRLHPKPSPDIRQCRQVAKRR